MNTETCGNAYKKSSLNVKPLRLLPITADFLAYTETHDDLSLRCINNHNANELRRLISMPFDMFWRSVLQQKEDESYVAAFITSTSFIKLQNHMEDGTEAVLKLVCRLIKRIYGPENYLKAEERSDKFKEWISNDWAEECIRSGVISSQSFFNVIEVLYKYGKPRRKITKILNTAFSNPNILKIIRSALSVFVKISNYINTYFAQRGLKEFLEVDQHNKGVQSTQHNSKISFSLPRLPSNDIQTEYEFSKSALFAVCSGARDFAMTFTLSPSLVSLVHEGNNNHFVTVMSIMYRIASRNLFLDFNYYRDPYTNLKVVENSFEKVKEIMDKPLEDLTYSDSDNSVDLLFKLKYSILSLMERYIWLKFGHSILDCLEHNNPDNITPKFLEDYFEFSGEPSSYSVSGIVAAEYLSQFSITLSNFEITDREIVTGTLPKKYVYLINAPLIADLNKRSNLLKRVKEAHRFHCPLCDAYYITHSIDVLTDVSNATQTPNASNEKVKSSEVQPIENVARRLLKFIPILDDTIISVLCGALDYDASETLSFALDHTEKIESLSKHQILKMAADIIASRTKELSLSSILLMNLPSSDVRKKTLDLYEMNYQEELEQQENEREYSRTIHDAGISDSVDKTLRKYFSETQSVYSKSSRNTEARQQLKTATDLDDHQIESWCSYYKRFFKDKPPQHHEEGALNVSLEHKEHSVRRPTRGRGTRRSIKGNSGSCRGVSKRDKNHSKIT